MIKREIEELAVKIIEQIPEGWNGADRADLFACLGQKLGMTHLLIPDARPEHGSLPTVAPEIFADRDDKKEAAPDFLRRVYAPWLGHGLGRHHLLSLDRSLYNAVDNWLRKAPLPDDIDLPTKKELINRELAQAGWSEGETLPYPSYHTGLKDKLRLYNAARNRRKSDD